MTSNIKAGLRQDLFAGAFFFRTVFRNNFFWANFVERTNAYGSSRITGL